ncbi:PfkB family carbohydrate kinase [Adhaeribacter aquaticus]|uniref:PfkB family carbohydrate kinase n=1 Tax=Adhaeribacter aquaticus TaxID=299567 RepID=UPI00040412CF|nr:PfkB family carbohydrate kinase [Adhaeribacter aquaticus]
MSLLVVGSVAFDALETPFGKTDKIVGGSASFISLSSSYFVKPVNIVAVVGGDFQKSDIEKFQEHGIDTTGLQIRENEKSFFWSGRYFNDMNSRETLVTELNVLEDFDPIIPDSYQNCEYLMLGNLAPQVQRTVIERLQNRPKLIVMDTMNFWMDVAYKELLKTIALVDVISINDEEARQLSKEYSLVKAAKKILAMGPKYVIIKKGEHGALLFSNDDMFYAPALPLDEVFDPTGAGDTFVGGFIGYLAKYGEATFYNMKNAVIHGSAMASFCVEKFGTERLLNLSDREIEKRVQQFSRLVQF